METLSSLLGFSLLDSLKKFIFKLGMGVITFGGFTLLYDQVKDSLTGNLAGMPQTMNQLLTISGCMDMLGIVLGALAVKVSFLALGKFGVLPT